jgi:hypothetical protein
MTRLTEGHPDLFGIQYRGQGLPMEANHDVLAQGVGVGIVSTIRNHLVRGPQGQETRPQTAFDLVPSEEGAIAATIQCELPGGAPSTPGLWRPQLMVEGLGRRLVPSSQMARLCTKALENVLGKSGLLSVRGNCTSGPAPFNIYRELPAYLAGLPELAPDAPPIRTSPEFAARVSALANAILAKITGSPEIPAITTRVEQRPAADLLT